jgi:serine/threonine protein kinase
LFPGKNLSKRIRLNTACKLDFGGVIYESVSDYAKNLLSAMLEVNPKNRITVEQALKHEFFQQIPQKKGNKEKIRDVASEE